MAAPNCLADGAPWFLPTSWCDCGVSATYPTIPPSSGVTASSANCAYTVLPTATINPTSNTNSAAPTNVPGQNGVSGCAYYLAADQGLPSGTPNYCFCGGGPNVPAADAPLLTHTDVNPPVTDCNYATQPPTGWSPTTTPPPPPPAATSPTPATPTCYGSGLYNMRASTAVAAASTYCSHIASQAAGGATISNNWPGGCSYQNTGAVYQPPADGDTEAGMSDLSFSAGQDTSNDYCKAQSVSSLKIVETDCNTALGMAINGCMSSCCNFPSCRSRSETDNVGFEGDTDTVDTKHGGRTSINCVSYAVFPAPFGNNYPCEGQFCRYGWLQNCSPP